MGGFGGVDWFKGFGVLGPGSFGFWGVEGLGLKIQGVGFIGVWVSGLGFGVIGYRVARVHRFIGAS